MDLREQPSFTDTGAYDRCTVPELLGEIASEVRGRAASEVREWQAIVAWADENVITSDTDPDVATSFAGLVDTGVPIAGPNAPLVSEFGLMELIAVLGRSPDGGRAYVGRVVACAWRLPNLYEAVVTGRVAPWKAHRIAEATMSLNPDATAYVDRQVTLGAGGIGWAQLDRLIQTAITRFDPEAAEARREQAADQRRFDIDTDEEHGLAIINGLLDAADGRDLNQAVARRAALLGSLGDECSLDVRRAKAVGELARVDLALDPEPSTDPGRRCVLNVHITDTTLTGTNPVARWEDTGAPVSTEQVREWLGSCSTIVVRPVIDTNNCTPVDSWEIPERLKARVRLRDHTCRFPHCTRPAEACDLDHCQPWHQGGATCPCQLVPLCRRHHRAKTFSPWRYSIIETGHYLWTSPHGRHWHVGPAGTRSLDPKPLGTEAGVS